MMQSNLQGGLNPVRTSSACKKRWERLRPFATPGWSEIMYDSLLLFGRLRVSMGSRPMIVVRWHLSPKQQGRFDGLLRP